MTTISVHQPAYFPWMPYWRRVERSDIHVVLDHCQFERGSFINRQKSKDGSWLTVPVSNKAGRICDVLIKGDSWREKHIKTIKQQYGLDAESWIAMPYAPNELFQRPSCVRLNNMLIVQFMVFRKILDIDTKIYSSSCHLDYKNMGTKQDLVVNICKHFHATKYLSGPLGRDYLNMYAFADAGIEVEFDDNPKDTRTILEYLAETDT